MKVRMIARPTCEGGNCPTTYLTDRDAILVQGYRTEMDGQVRVPESLLRAHDEAGGPEWPAGSVSRVEPGFVLVAGVTVDDAEVLAHIQPAADESIVDLGRAVAA